MISSDNCGSHCSMLTINEGGLVQFILLPKNDLIDPKENYVLMMDSIAKKEKPWENIDATSTCPYM